MKNEMKYTAMYSCCSFVSSAIIFNFLSGKIAKSRPELKKIINCVHHWTKADNTSGYPPIFEIFITEQGLKINKSLSIDPLPWNNVNHLKFSYKRFWIKNSDTKTFGTRQTTKWSFWTTRPASVPIVILSLSDHTVYCNQFAIIIISGNHASSCLARSS